MEAFIALGSNLGDRAGWLRHGLAGLAELGLDAGAQSSVWETEALGTRDPGDFLNMAVRVQTALEPLELLDRLLEVERAAGRVRNGVNAPRTLDLDLLCMGSLVVTRPRLTLPHPRMWQRRFVLEPLAEIAPDLRDPTSGIDVLTACEQLRATQRAHCVGPLASL